MNPPDIKKLIVGGCQKCKGTLAQEQDGLSYDDERKVYSIEYACTSCGWRFYREVKSLDGVKKRQY